MKKIATNPQSSASKKSQKRRKKDQRLQKPVKIPKEYSLETESLPLYKSATQAIGGPLSSQARSLTPRTRTSETTKTCFATGPRFSPNLKWARVASSTRWSSNPKWATGASTWTSRRSPRRSK